MEIDFFSSKVTKSRSFSVTMDSFLLQYSNDAKKDSENETMYAV